MQSENSLSRSWLPDITSPPLRYPFKKYIHTLDFIYLLIPQILFSAYNVPGSFLNTDDRLVNKTDKNYVNYTAQSYFLTIGNSSFFFISFLCILPEIICVCTS